MKIEFKTLVYENSWDGPYESHQVIVDGKVLMQAAECIEPEDVRFYRDLHSPFECEEVVKLAIEATKRGEEVEFIYTEVKDED